MKYRIFIVFMMGLCLSTWTLADLVEARGGGRGGGGGGFSRGGGGGGFSRGGSGNFGSIRNSARPSTRDMSRLPRGDLNHPSQVRLTENQSQRLQDRASNRTPEQQQALKDRAASLTPDQKQQIQNRVANLTPEQKQDLRQKYQDSGLSASQLPAEEREYDRENWQEWRDQNREDWQEWYEDTYDDHWDYYHYGWWYGYPVSTVSYSFYIDDKPPCQQTVVINQAGGTSTYYYCNSVWYQPAYAAGNVKYVVASPPAGAELTMLSKSYKITVDGVEYFLSNHVFYQKIARDGQAVYVTVEAPVGAMVPTIPPYAVEIKHNDQTYYRFDKIFYQREGPVFIVVANPGV